MFIRHDCSKVSTLSAGTLMPAEKVTHSVTREITKKVFKEKLSNIETNFLIHHLNGPIISFS